VCLALLATLTAVSAGVVAAAEPSFTWRQTDTSIALLSHGKVVWQHVHDKAVGKPYMRIGLLDGTELTRPWPFAKDYPKADHTWHKALWWSWKAIDGVNYWEENQQGTEPVKVEIAHEANGSAKVCTTIAYHLPDKPPVVNEQRTITVGAPDASGSYLIEWQAKFTPAGDADVVFNRNGYGGLAIRMAAEYCGDVDGVTKAWTFVRSEEPDGDKSRTARWMAYHGVAQNGRPAAVAIFSHPSNPRYPARWQTRGHYPYLNPSFTCDEDYTLRRGESLTLRYGILVCQGAYDAKKIEAAWKGFAGGGE